MKTNSIVMIAGPNFRNFWLKLLGVMLVSVIAALFISFVWTAISNRMVESARPKPTDAESFPRLAPNLSSKLDDAIYPASTFNTASLVNPTLDPANLTNLKIAMTAPVNQQFPQVGINQRVPVQTGVPNMAVNPNQVAPNNVIVPVKPSVVDLSERLKEFYRNRMRGDETPSIATLFYLDEVIAVGYAGDESGREILFYSEGAKKTFAAPLGTNFKDGTLLSVSDDGVTFQTLTGPRFLPWSRRGKSNSVAPIINPDARTDSQVKAENP